PDGTIRGFNVPVFLRDLSIRPSFRPRFSGHRELGEVVAREHGLIVITEPDYPGAGSELRPIPFQGVALNTYYVNGEAIGTLHINWLEGRIVRLQPPEIPGQLIRRFGFYGFILRGTGCFAGAQGLVHGSGGGALDPPVALSDQAFDNYYIVQLNDPQHR